MQDITVSENLIRFLIFLPLFFLSIALHEFAHAYFADKFGDSTPRSQGRLTLNPLKHIDLIGTVLMPFAAFASGLPLIGWAKPVMINRNNFRNPYKDDAIVSFAGPLSNFLLALLFLILLSIMINIAGAAGSGLLITTMLYGIYLNVFLFLFNLLPIPPLDGSHILFNLYPNKYTAMLVNLGFYGSIVLLLFIWSPLWKYFSGLIMAVYSFLVGVFV